MTEYITKDQAIHAMEQVTQPECFIEDTRKNFAKIIEKLPAADVAPVRHRRWTRIDYHDARCSECGHKTYYPDRISLYCPECGARMDGGNNND